MILRGPALSCVLAAGRPNRVLHRVSLEIIGVAAEKLHELGMDEKFLLSGIEFS